MYSVLEGSSPSSATFLFFLDIDDISAVRTGYNYLYNKLKLLGTKDGLNINQGFIQRLNIEYIVGMLIQILYFLNLCAIVVHLEMIYIRNVYYAKMLIMD